jgi:hypothetical protein
MLDLSALPAPQRREARDFVQFLLARQAGARKPDTTYHFSDLCGSLNWQGDAIAAQRSLRDEW